MRRLSPEYLTRVEERAVEVCTERALGVADAMLGEDGEAYGQIPVDGVEFMAFYADLVERPHQLQDGRWVVLNILEHLRVVSPKAATELDRRLELERRRLADRAS